MKLPPPTLQVAFATLLDGSRKTVLRDALLATLKATSIVALDKELATFVPCSALADLASRGLRGEMMFATPLLLAAKPSLIGYYRLLYGYSQKAFYKSGTGRGMFRGMEMRGTISTGAAKALPVLCRALADAGVQLLNGIADHVSGGDVLHELSLLTLGAQYRGGANNDRGSAGIRAVFEVLREIAGEAVVSEGESVVTLLNAAQKTVTIKVAADPDILILSHLAATKTRPVVAIEVKAGEDHSNIHNRVGEAEKSHLKARAAGVTECWTIINVRNVDMAKLKQESKSTDRFYQLLDLVDSDSAEYQEFRDRVRDLVGLA